MINRLILAGVAGAVTLTAGDASAFGGRRRAHYCGPTMYPTYCAPQYVTGDGCWPGMAAPAMVAAPATMPGAAAGTTAGGGATTGDGATTTAPVSAAEQKMWDELMANKLVTADKYDLLWKDETPAGRKKTYDDLMKVMKDALEEAKKANPTPPPSPTPPPGN